MSESGAGPVELLSVVFPASASADLIGQSLRPLLESAHVDVLDLVVGSRTAGGRVEFAEFAESRLGLGLDEVEVPLRTLIALEDLEAIAETVSADELVVVLVIEHTWRRALDERAVLAGGRVVVDEWIDPEDFLAALAAETNHAQEA